MDDQASADGGVPGRELLGRIVPRAPERTRARGTLYERDSRRIRAAVPTFLAMPVLQAVALARYSDTVDWGGLSLWLYLLYLASLLVLGGFGLLRILDAREPADAPLAAALP